jgi:uncharacterized membrane protein YtjA (UPF0391 family)
MRPVNRADLETAHLAIDDSAMAFPWSTRCPTRPCDWIIVGSQRCFEVSIDITILGFRVRETKMIQLAITCLIIALVAAILGFGGIAGSFVGIAKILFLVFLVLAVLSFFAGGMRRGI